MEAQSIISTKCYSTYYVGRKYKIHVSSIFHSKFTYTQHLFIILYLRYEHDDDVVPVLYFKRL